jgi:hypothetical protein
MWCWIAINHRNCAAALVEKWDMWKREGTRREGDFQGQAGGQEEAKKGTAKRKKGNAKRKEGRNA